MGTTDKSEGGDKERTQHRTFSPWSVSARLKFPAFNEPPYCLADDTLQQGERQG